MKHAARGLEVIRSIQAGYMNTAEQRAAAVAAGRRPPTNRDSNRSKGYGIAIVSGRGRLKWMFDETRRRDTSSEGHAGVQ